MKRICVFCGSNAGARPSYLRATVDLGELLAARGIGLVYGGGNVGLMGALADAALAKGGEVIGVIPQSLLQRELGNTACTELRIVESMHQRKQMMADLSDAFIALPGGFGTLEEFCEMVTWSQLGIQHKPCGLLNVRGYYDPLLRLFDQAVEEKFLLPENRGLVLVSNDAAALLQQFESWKPPKAKAWISKEES